MYTDIYIYIYVFMCIHMYNYIHTIMYTAQKTIIKVKFCQMAHVFCFLLGLTSSDMVYG